LLLYKIKMSTYKDIILKGDLIVENASSHVNMGLNASNELSIKHNSHEYISTSNTPVKVNHIKSVQINAPLFIDGSNSNIDGGIQDWSTILAGTGIGWNKNGGFRESVYINGTGASYNGDHGGHSFYTYTSEGNVSSEWNRIRVYNDSGHSEIGRNDSDEFYLKRDGAYFLKYDGVTESHLANNYFSGKMGIGLSVDPSSRLRVYDSTTDTSSTLHGLTVAFDDNPETSATGAIRNIYSRITHSGPSDRNYIHGCLVEYGIGGTNAGANVLTFDAYKASLFTLASSQGGVTSQATNFRSAAASFLGTGNITKAVGLELEPLYNASYSTNTYGINQVGSNDKNYFAGNVGIGIEPNANILSTSGLINFEYFGNDVIKTDVFRRTIFGEGDYQPVGTTNAGFADLVHIEGIGGSSNAYVLSSVVNRNDGVGSIIAIGKSRGVNSGSNTIVQDEDVLGEIVFCGADGVDMSNIGGSISVYVNGTPSENIIPGRIQFKTTNPSGVLTPALTISSDQSAEFNSRVGIGGEANINASLDIQGSKGIILPRLPADPTAAEGMIYFHTGIGKMRFFNGTAWETIHSS
jgi:hypothetical protein